MMLKGTVKLAGLALVLTMASAVVGWAMPQDAKHPVEGTYEVSATGNELGTIKFFMVIKREGEKWTAEVRDSPLPMTVNSVTVDGENNIIINVAAGDVTVVISGKYDTGKLAGDWKAGDTAGTWSAAKQEAGAAAEKSAVVAAGVAAELEGTYDVQVTAEGQGTLPFVLIIKRDGGKLVTAVENAGDLNIVGIEVKEDAVTLAATFQGNPFALPGKRAGNELSGKWEAGGFSGTWSAKKRTGN